MTDLQTEAPVSREALAAAYPFRVLLSPPTSRTIPIMGLQAEAGRPLNEVWSISSKDVTKALDKQALGRLRSGKFGDYRYLTTRHKDGLRVAFYAPWLAFAAESMANRFTTEHPRYGFDNLLAIATRRKATIEHDLAQGLAKGRYNLNALEPEIRYRKAKLYVEQIDETYRLAEIEKKLSQLALLNPICPPTGSSFTDCVLTL